MTVADVTTSARRADRISVLSYRCSPATRRSLRRWFRAAIAAFLLSANALRPVLVDDMLDNAVAAGLVVGAVEAGLEVLPASHSWIAGAKAYACDLISGTAVLSSN